MKVITVMGIDLAKNIFQVHAEDRTGKVVVRKRLNRRQIAEFVAKTPPCLIGIEACSGANYWTLKFEQFGHTVKMIPPQYVKPFVKTNKNDMNDAEAICEAVQRPNMHFVPKKSVEQQDIQMLHRIRQRIIKSRTALVNEARGSLSEYGIIIGLGVGRFSKSIVEIINDSANGLTVLARRKMQDFWEELGEMQNRIEGLDKELLDVFNRSEVCKRIGKIPGIGPVTATAIVAKVSDAGVFKNGRQMSAWLGIVPRQNSSGGKTQLQGISKRGDVYLRTLLIQGGRAVVRVAPNKTDRRNIWIAQKALTRGKNKAAVAVANKNARIIWKLLKSGENYNAAA